MSNKKILMKDGKALIDKSGNVLVAENIGVEGATIKTKGNYGIPVPSENGTYVENIYFNTALSVEEVVSILNNANINGEYLLAMNSDQSLMIGIVVEGEMCIIADYSSYQIYFHNVVGAEAELGFPVGWNPDFNGTISVNTNISNDGTVGLQNDLISRLIGIDPTFEYQEGKEIELSGEYAETSLNITSKEKIILNDTIINNKQIPLQINVDLITVDEYITGKYELIDFYSDDMTSLRSYSLASTQVTEVNIPSATSIGSYALADCQQLTNIICPNVTYIGNNAFKNTYQLTEINIPLVSNLGNYAFEYSGITTIYLPQLIDIPAYAFFGTNLSSVTNEMFESATHIRESAFGNCKNLTKVDLTNVTSIGNNAFGGCSNLTEVNIPNVTAIDDKAFSNCSNLTTLDLTNVQHIYGSPFYETSITKLDLPNLTDTMGRLSEPIFHGMKKLTTIHLKKITGIKSFVRPFVFCYALTDIYLGCDEVFSIVDYRIFDDIPKGCKIHVKSAYADQYAEWPEWKTAISFGLVEIIGDYEEVYGE